VDEIGLQHVEFSVIAPVDGNTLKSSFEDWADAIFIENSVQHLLQADSGSTKMPAVYGPCEMHKVAHLQSPPQQRKTSFLPVLDVKC